MKTNLRKAILAKLIFFVLGISSTIWFLSRVITKPSRATYPCMKAAAPIMSGFITYLLSVTGTIFAFKEFRKRMASSKYIAAASFLIATLAMVTITITSNLQEAKAMDLVSATSFKANEPIGTASGLKPGRVVWVWDNNATDENLTSANNKNQWWANYTNNEVVEKMLDKAITGYADIQSLPQAWDALFKYFNEQHGKGSVGYTAGEKIYIKINVTNSCCSVSGTKKNADFDRMDNTPEVLLALLKQLIEEVGVKQSDIYLGDPFRTFHDLYWDLLHTAYPYVVYCDGKGANGRHQTVPTENHVMLFSDGKLQYRIPQEYVNSAYLINVPCLKTHDSGGITLGAKNHQGSILQDGATASAQSAFDMHYALPDHDATDGGHYRYRHLVDYLGHEQLGGKTLITIIDGIWAGRSWEGYVEKWNSEPFNGDYPSSLLVSQDRVAVDAVGYDFLLEEYKNKTDKEKYAYMAGTDDYLYQAADPANWPEGVTYDPEGDGTPLKSLGVYEHWNNATDKEYSRNLGTGEGIELKKIDLSSKDYTPDNSGLASPKVNKIYIDSFNVKWFGTDKGISRFDGANWNQINKSNYLKENTINDITYEKTNNGHEIWVATNGGLSVMSFNVDGVTAATTYRTGGAESGILNDTITAVGLDKNHTRWIATPKGVNTFGAKGWNSIATFIDCNHDVQNWNRLKVNSIKGYNNDGSVYMGTTGQGVIRMSYNDVDGFTGASALTSVWSGLWSDTVHSVVIYDTVQWYGTNQGVFAHYGPSTKEFWNYSITPWDEIMDPIVYDIEKDNNGNIWLGTQNGLCILSQSSNIAISPDKTNATISWTSGNGFVSSLDNETINDLQLDSEGNMWIATNNGVKVLNNLPASTKQKELKHVVFISETIVNNITPTNWATYNASSEYGKGSSITSWYCVYNGTRTEVTISGLKPFTTYWVTVFDYTGEPGFETYSIAEGANNPASFTSGDVSANELAIQNLRAYPVPFDNYLEVAFDSGKNRKYDITISDAEGKIFKRTSSEKGYQKIETSTLPKGIYLIKVSDGTKEKVIKVIK